MALTPKKCSVTAIKLDGRGNAEVRLACPGPDYSMSYRTVRVKASQVSHRGAHIDGAAEVRFTTAPAHAKCKKVGKEITCTMVGDKSSASLSGLKTRKRRKR